MFLPTAAIHMDDEALNQSLERLNANLEADHRALSALIISGLDDRYSIRLSEKSSDTRVFFVDFNVLLRETCIYSFKQ